MVRTLFPWARRWTTQLLKTSRKPKKVHRHARLGVEALETRDLPDGTVLAHEVYNLVPASYQVSVEVTVSADVPGYEGLYLWQYHVASGTAIPAGPPIYFNLRFDAGADVANVTGPADWTASVVLASGVFWEGATGIEPGSGGDFSFTTDPRPLALIDAGAGAAGFADLTGGVLGPADAPGDPSEDEVYWSQVAGALSEDDWAWLEGALLARVDAIQAAGDAIELPPDEPSAWVGEGDAFLALEGGPTAAEVVAAGRAYAATRAAEVAEMDRLERNERAKRADLLARGAPDREIADINVTIRQFVGQSERASRDLAQLNTILQGTDNAAMAVQLDRLVSTKLQQADTLTTLSKQSADALRAMPRTTAAEREAWYLAALTDASLGGRMIEAKAFANGLKKAIRP